jgi:hypothetical protein
VGYTGFESEGSVGEDALPRAHRCDEVWVLFPNHPARKRSVEPGVVRATPRSLQRMSWSTLEGPILLRPWVCFRGSGRQTSPS